MMVSKGADGEHAPVQVEAPGVPSIADALADLPDTIEPDPEEEVVSVGLEPAWLLLAAAGGGAAALAMGLLVGLITWALG